MKKRIDAVIGSAITLVALAFYLISMSHGAYPGKSAHLIAVSQGLAPRLDTSSPLWHWFAGAIGSLPFASDALLLNLFSVLCATVSVFLLYSIVSRCVTLAIDVYDSNRAQAKVAARVGGTIAAAAMAFSIPFWIVATRAHVASFDILLLLVIVRILVSFVENGRIWQAALLAFLYGAGVVEFATMIVLFPFAAFFVLYVLWRQEEVSVRSISTVGAAGIAGLCFYLLAALDVYGSPAYELREYGGFFKIIWQTWRAQYLLITRSLPRFGWLVIILVSGVPWVAVLLAGRRALNEEKDWGFYSLHLIISAVTAAVLLNTPISPRSFTGDSRLLVTPYVLVASVAGYLAAYWYMLPVSWWPDAEDALRRKIRSVSGPLLAIVWGALCAAAPVLNWEEAGSLNGRFVNVYSDSVVESLEGRGWLVTGGFPDNNLVISAAEKGIDLKILSLARDENPIYMRYVASMFDDVRLKNMAGIGMFPLLSEWMESDPEIEKKLALLLLPDLWMSAGWTAIPNKTVFLGGSRDKLEPESVMAAQRAFMSDTVQQIKNMDSGDLDTMKSHILSRLSLVANNLGVLMHDTGRREYAYEAYSMATNAFPDNVSAILNLGSLVSSGYPAPDAKKIERELEATVAEVEKGRGLWSLSRDYGYVRSPQAYAHAGLGWAFSGRPGLAVAGLERAMEMIPGRAAGGIKETLAGLYLSRRMEVKSRELYKEILAGDPDNPAALLGMARISMAENELDEAARLLKRVEQSEAGPVVDFEFARLHLARGDIAKARSVLEGLIEERPRRLKALRLLAEVLLVQDDREALRGVLHRLNEVRGGQTVVASVRAQLALREGNRDLALSHLRDAVEGGTENTRLIRQLMRFEMLRGNEGRAVDAARSLLRIIPGDASAHYIIGKVQMMRGDLDLAEDSLRRSIEQRRSVKALNDLAWLLQEKGEHQDAEELAREAVAKTPELGEAWDTLGVILMRQERFEEARKALNKALAFSSRKAPARLSMAELEAITGDLDAAKSLLEQIKEKMRMGAEIDPKRISRVQRIIDGTSRK